MTLRISGFLDFAHHPEFCFIVTYNSGWWTKSGNPGSLSLFIDLYDCKT
jgi:hypothetical protein